MIVAEAVAARRRAEMVSGLRGLARPRPPRVAGPDRDRPGSDRPGSDRDRSGGDRGPGDTRDRGGPSVAEPDVESCDLCGLSIPSDHRHLLHLVERRIVCSCEACWGMRSGEGDYRPVGSRTLWLPALDLPDELWASFQIPIGLAFFLHSTVTSCVVAMYPSPAGATESELHFDAWARMCELNPVLARLEPDIEGLIVNRLLDPPLHVIAPIDRCYALTGAIKVAWEGISGGTGVDHAVTRFFDELRAQAVPA